MQFFEHRFAKIFLPNRNNVESIFKTETNDASYAICQLIEKAK